jgi:hypothetical protein
MARPVHNQHDPTSIANRNNRQNLCANLSRRKAGGTRFSPGYLLGFDTPVPASAPPVAQTDDG